MKKEYIAVVDYGMGNLFSIMNICKHVGIQTIKTSDKDVIRNASGVILPGVGAFGVAMNVLEELDLTSVLINVVDSGKPFLGICLGMQLLMSEGEEFGVNKGLNIIKGKVVRFPNLNNKNDKVKVPHIGWNKIYLGENTKARFSILNNIRDEDFVYFIHSFFVVPENKEVIITHTDYGGIRYCSGIQKDNLIAFQFHPEKSGPTGIQLFKNFRDLIRKETRNG